MQLEMSIGICTVTYVLSPELWDLEGEEDNCHAVEVFS